MPNYLSDANTWDSGQTVNPFAPRAAGVASVSSGTVTVNTSLVTANSLIFLSPLEGVLNVGILRVSARVAGTSFTILSSNVLMSGNVAWSIIEP